MEKKTLPDISKRPHKGREKWNRKIDFIFAVAGGSIGLGNVWRFPYLCYKNGGGVFLIPYLVFLIGAAIPLFFLETALGQLTSKSASRAWNIIPLMRGIGYASMTIMLNSNIYFMTVLVWSLQYFVASFSSVQPWSTCDNAWNTNSCFVYGKSNTSILRGNSIAVNQTNTSSIILNHNITKVSSVTEYWERGVLGISSGVHHLGRVRYELLGYLAFAWIIVYFCIWKGISWTSKIVYFTATFPLAMLVVLFIRGITLPGAGDGIYFYLKPNFTMLAETQVWMDAATQVLFSYFVTAGIIVAMGSYNSFHHNLYRDTIIFSFLNSGTSFFSGFSIFSILGFMAQEQNTTIATVAESGPGLLFLAYPKAVSLMPFPQLWGVLFFLMILLLGLDTQFMGQESFITCLMDLKPTFFNKPKRRELLVAAACFVQFLVGTIMITEGGIYVFYMYDNYAAAGWCVFFLGVCECITISWLFGINRFWKYVCRMLRFRPFPYFKYALATVTPLMTLVVSVQSLVKYQPLTYNRTYQYPPWAIFVCWCLAMSAILWVPCCAIYTLFQAKGTFRQRWAEVIRVPDDIKDNLELEDFSRENKDVPLIDCHNKF